MEKDKFIAVYMDHASANIMEFVNDVIQTQLIESEFNHQEKEKSLHKNEALMHHKEQQLQLSYYNAIKDALKKSNTILLFGATTAKNELLNLMKADSHFKNIKIECEKTDKMTVNQQHDFIKKQIKTQLF